MRPGHAVPVWLKIAYTAFVAVMVPTYWVSWGPANFLWFCDVTVLLTTVALWLESPLLASMQAVGAVTLQATWIVDFVGRVITGRHLTGTTEYMFDAEEPFFTRCLSGFHGWLPLLLLWLVWRLGYDRRALRLQTAVACMLLVLSCFAVPGPTTPVGNLNKVFGPNDKEPQTFAPMSVWVAGLMVFYTVCFFLPGHIDLCPGHAARTGGVAERSVTNQADRAQ
jgi:hypothetical protein